MLVFFVSFAKVAKIMLPRRRRQISEAERQRLRELLQDFRLTIVGHRPLEEAIVTAGGGAGGAIMVPLLAWLIVNFGWRTASVTTGFMLLILGLLAAYFMRSTPEEMGLLPDGEAMPEAAEAVYP